MHIHGSDTCRVRWELIVAVVGLVVLASWPAGAQGTTSAIIGQVTDQSDAVLPGVTVTVSSPALQVGQTVEVTNAVGEYRFSPLPAGLFEVLFELPGFQSVAQQDIQLTAGFTATVDMELGLSELAETLTVTGESPVVDLTETASNTMLTNSVLELSAVTRNGIMSLLTLTPGVRTFTEVGGGAMMLENATARVYGVGGSQWYTLDGMAAQTSNQSVSWDYGAMEEVQVVTSGGDAEHPTRGVNINAIIKSGGNEFTGSATLSGANTSFVGNNLDAELEALGITTGDALDFQYDTSADLGGRLVRDKLWFYSSVRKRRAAYDVLNTFKPDGSPGQLINRQRTITNKISYQATPSNRFVFLNMWGSGDEEKGLNELLAFETREVKKNNRPNTKIQWTGVRGTNLVADLQFAHLTNVSGGGFLNDPPIIGRSDLETGFTSGDNVIAGEIDENWNYHTTGNVTYFLPDAAGGSHEFKAGFDYNALTDWRPGQEAKDINYHLQTANGIPDRVVFMNSPNRPIRQARILGAYVRDSWRVGNRLTMNLGARFSRESAFTPQQCRGEALFPSDVMFPEECFDKLQLPIHNLVVPRLHAAFDLLGDGRTVLKGGFGRFGNRRGVGIVQRYNPNATRYGVFAWRDLNGNNDWDQGETNRDPNGPDFIEVVGSEFSGIPPVFVPNPDEKQVLFDEYTVALEHELMANMSVRVSGIYSQTRRVQRSLNRNRPFDAYNIPITNQDPGPDGVLGTGDDGGMFTYFEYSTDLQGLDFEEFTPINDDAGNMSFKTIEVSTVKRLSNNWQLQASYTATKTNWPIAARNSAASLSFGSASPGFSASGASAGFVTPNALINTSNDTWDWDAKLSGAYLFPAGVSVSANYHHTSGDPFARTVRFRGGVTIPSIVLAVEPIGSQRRPNLNITHIRIEKQFALTGAQRVAVLLNMYNAFNANTVIQMQNRSGDSFLRPRSILSPRLFELGVRYLF